VVNCSIKYLINIVLGSMSSTPMYTLQHQHFNLILRSVLRVYAILDKCFPVFSTEVSKGNSNSEVSKS